MELRIGLAFWAASTYYQLVSSFHLLVFPSLSNKVPFNPFIPQLVLILGGALALVQHLAHGVVELHEVHLGIKGMYKPEAAVKKPFQIFSLLMNLNIFSVMHFWTLAE